MMQKYKVGQVLFMVKNDKNAIVPIMIVEEICKRTRDGEVITYIAQCSADENNTINIDKLGDQSHLFDDHEAAATFLKNKINSIIDHKIAAAVDAAKVWYNVDVNVNHISAYVVEEPQKKQRRKVAPVVPPPPMSDGVVKVVDDDGVERNVKIVYRNDDAKQVS